MELWKSAFGYEGFYEVSDLGRVRRIWKNGKHRVITHRNYTRNYPSIALTKNKKRKVGSLHRLVAKTWIPNPENKPCVNHLNGDVRDCRVINLSWCTYSENLLHSYRVLSRKPPKITGLRNGVSRAIIDVNNGDIFYSVKELADYTGLNRSTLVNKLSGNKKNNTNFIYLTTIKNRKNVN